MEPLNQHPSTVAGKYVDPANRACAHTDTHHPNSTKDLLHLWVLIDPVSVGDPQALKHIFQERKKSFHTVDIAQIDE